VCNLYSLTNTQDAMRALFRVGHDRTGNLPTLPGSFPDYEAPIVRASAEGGRELVMARWGMPSFKNAAYAHFANGTRTGEVATGTLRPLH